MAEDAAQVGRWVPVGGALLFVALACYLLRETPVRTLESPRRSFPPGGVGDSFRAVVDRPLSSSTDAGASGDVAAITSATAELLARLRHLLVTNPVYQRYLACLASADEEIDCADLRESALSTARTRLPLSSLDRDQDQYGFWAAASLFGQDRVHALLTDLLLSARDEIDRIGILTILDRTNLGGPRELPRAAYDDLESRSNVELALLLRRHRGTPMTYSDVASSIYAMASDSAADNGRRYPAIMALGHPQTAAYVIEFVNARAEQGGVDEGLGVRLAQALAGCGPTCGPAVDRLARGGENERLALYGALARMPPAQAAELWSRVEPWLPEPTEMSRREALEWERTRSLVR